jgi:AcrR family transcriptional regulator
VRPARRHESQRKHILAPQAQTTTLPADRRGSPRGGAARARASWLRSIGSLYEYFPDKQAIFAALHDRHVDEVRHVIERTMADCTSASLEALMRELVERLANVHSEHAELHEIVSAAVPGSADGFKRALQAAFAQVISPTRQDRYTAEETERMLFILPHMVEALVHGVGRQPQVISRGRAKDEAIRTVAVYLSSCQGSHLGRY